jgi:hypothetical protein
LSHVWQPFFCFVFCWVLFCVCVCVWNEFELRASLARQAFYHFSHSASPSPFLKV